jgi:NAD+ synthase (glutamine-hydrolysing)
MMPFEFTSQLSRSLASRQAEDLGINYCEIPINGAFEAFTSSLKSQFLGSKLDVTEQNIQARCRGVMLMAISNKKNFLVLTTGNKSEIAVGYSTLYGDMAGGFNVLKDVSKTLVYDLARYRNERLCKGNKMAIPLGVIDRAPSAELAPNQLDEDSLPAYDILDLILGHYIEGDASAQEIIGKGFNRETVEKVLRMVDMNEYKRRQSPLGIRLTERGFGRDRRYPVTNGWPLLD